MVGAAFSGYLFGSMPTAYFLGRWLKGIDIRRVGARNMGSLNAFRVLGPFWGAVTFLVDAGKGVLAVAFARWSNWSEAAIMLAGIMAVVGHNWPFFLGFKGGKGAATSLGVVAATQPPELTIVLAVVIACYALTRNVSFGLGLAFVALPFLNIYLSKSPELVTLSWALLALMAMRLGTSTREVYEAAQGSLRRFIHYTIFGVPEELRQ
ncbi:MAG TPA: glycerol-3-phosphate acyltransferase [Bacillota bacterium]